jgi:hypothetical protein
LQLDLIAQIVEYGVATGDALFGAVVMLDS